MKKSLLIILSIFLMASFTNTVKASHLMGGEITYIHLGGNNYEVTLIVYNDCSGSMTSGNSQIIRFESASCGIATTTQTLNLVGTPNNVSQLCPTALSTCDSPPGTNPGVQEFVYRGILSLPPCNDWIIHWNSAARNGAITNLLSPVTSFYIQATLNNIVGANNNSPQFFTLPTPYLCVNQLSIFNHGASDVDGDSLYFSFNTPLTTPGPPGALMNFNTAAGYNLLNPMLTASGMNLNQQTGEMCFTPNQAQVSVVSILIEEFRGNVLIGTQIREMQVIVDGTCNNQAPVAGGVSPNCGLVGGMIITQQGPTVTQTDSNSLVMCPFDTICFEVEFSDLDPTNLITVTSNIGSSIPTAIFNVINNGTSNAKATICWVPTPLDSGLNVFAVQVTDNACPITATSTFTYDITVNDQPYAGLDDTICGNQGAQLQALGGGNYTWSVITGDPINVGVNFSCTNCDNPIASPAITTTYLLTSGLGAACLNTDTVTVVRVPDFTALAIPDTAVCVFGGALVPVQLNSTPDSIGYIYSWDNAGTLSNSSIASPIATPTTTTDYIVTITSPFGCSKTDTATVNVTTFPAISITGDTTNCPGDSVLLSATAGTGYSYSWFPSGDTTQTLYADSGKYVVTIDVNGCEGHTDTVNVSVIHVSKPIISDTAFCQGTGVFVNVLGGPYNSYTWSPTLGVTPGGGITIGDTYTVTVDSLGCSITSDAIVVTENPMPTPTILGNTFYCHNDSVILTVKDDYDTYLWNPTGSTDTITKAGTGPITITATDAIGCTGTASINILSHSPQATILGLDSICPGEFDSIYVSVLPSFNTDSYLWSNGETNDSTEITIGDLYVNVTDINGCTDSAYANVYSWPVPSADFMIAPLPQGQPFIESTFTDLSTGLNIVTWNWAFGDGSYDDNQNTVHAYENQGSYVVSLTITNDKGCESIKTEEYLILSDIIIPNVFTPNGDIHNQFLTFKNAEYYTNHLEVFNRWGSKVHSADNYKNDWNGDNLSDGTYFFILDVTLPNGEQQQYKGSVNLLR